MDHAFRWTAQRIAVRLKLLRPLTQRDSLALEPMRYRALDSSADSTADWAPVALEVDDSDWEVVEPHTYWGEQGTDFVFRTGFTVPRDWAAGPIALFLPMGVAGDIFTHPESLLYLDGEPIASADRYHHLIRLRDSCRDQRRHQVALHGWTGLAGWPPDPSLRDKLFMRPCALVRIDQPTEDFVRLAGLMLDAAAELGDERPEKHHLLNALDTGFAALDLRDPLRGPRFYDSVPAALTLLQSGVRDAGEPLDVHVYAVGHAHMDVAYLWRTRQMRRKNARTYSNVVRLLDAVPDYRYSHSQPQLYHWTEQDYPALFETIRTQVAEGRWEPMGAMWVEPDTNITGAESLVRQLVLGRRYFAERFGDLAEQAGRAPGERIDTPVLWLPDTFGFSWSLPQLMRQAGIPWFLTSKVNWNQHNRLPVQQFQWQGIDGSRVLTHVLTTPRPVQHLPFPTTYKAEVTPAEVLGSWQNFDQKSDSRNLMMVYGYGDGGGGPTDDLVRKAGLMKAMPGMPRVRMSTVRDFFEALEADGPERLPVWNDELYMEGHRGVLTTHGDIKRANRRGERLLHRLEQLAAYALLRHAHPYPHASLRTLWEILCLNQFHDILPGTAIREVFEDTLGDYAQLQRDGRAALQGAIDALSEPAMQNVGVRNGPEGRTAHENAGGPASDATQGAAPETLLLVNTAPVRSATVSLMRAEGGDAGTMPALRGRTQAVEHGRLFEHPALPANSLSTSSGTSLPGSGLFGAGHSGSGPSEAGWSGAGTAAGTDRATLVSHAQGHTLENALLRIELDTHGALRRVQDRRLERDVLVPGEVGNVLCVFEDRPLNWDAWDIDAFFEDRCDTLDEAVAVEVVETGPLRVAVRIEHRYRASRLVQTIRLTADSARLDFVTQVDWHETHALLKVAFPVQVFAPRATYEIQWGSIERPTHRNTSWDKARFEVAAQQWADLSEGDYGVALLNDCKYGYDIRDNLMRLSLIKSPTSPDPLSDQGQHRFTYSLFPHPGDWRNGVIDEARRLNDPVQVHPGRRLAGPSAACVPVRCSDPGVLIETIKAADDGRGLIVRLYESQRRRGPITLTFDRGIERVERCNLLEEFDGVLTVDRDSVTFDIRPFEVVSLRVR